MAAEAEIEQSELVDALHRAAIAYLDAERKQAGGIVSRCARCDGTLPSDSHALLLMPFPLCNKLAIYRGHPACLDKLAKTETRRYGIERTDAVKSSQSVPIEAGGAIAGLETLDLGRASLLWLASIATARHLPRLACAYCDRFIHKSTKAGAEIWAAPPYQQAAVLVAHEECLMKRRATENSLPERSSKTIMVH